MIVLDTRDITKRVTLCIMPISLRGDQSFRELRNKWVYDIRFFKEKCQDKLKTNTRFTNKQFQNNIKEIQRIDEDPYIERRRNEIFFQRKDDLLEKIQEKDEEVKQNNIEKSVEKAAKIALQVIEKTIFYLYTFIYQTLEKELSYEQLVIREEMLREKNEEKEIQKQIELEREKEVSDFLKVYNINLMKNIIFFLSFIKSKLKKFRIHNSNTKQNISFIYFYHHKTIFLFINYKIRNLWNKS